MQKAFPDATILKPAVLVGIEDRMFNNWAQLAMNLPFLPLSGGDSRIQVCIHVLHCMCAGILKLDEQKAGYETTCLGDALLWCMHLCCIRCSTVLVCGIACVCIHVSMTCGRDDACDPAAVVTMSHSSQHLLALLRHETSVPCCAAGVRA